MALVLTKGETKGLGKLQIVKLRIARSERESGFKW